VAIKRLIFVTACVGALAWMTWWWLSAGAQAVHEVNLSMAQATPLPSAAGPVVAQAAQPDTSPPLRDLVPSAPRQSPGGGEPPRELGRRPVPRAASAALEPDAALQSSLGAANMPAPLLNWDGISNINGVVPPDTQGDVGREHYIQCVNLSFAVYTKTTGALAYGPAAGNILWRGLGGPCESTNDGDPITLYDAPADRWFMSQFALPYNDGPFYQCLAVSASADPLGAWHRYVYTFTKMNDYPKFGVWPDGYYMTINQFTSLTGDWAGAGVAVFERDKLLAGLPARMIFFDLESVNDDFGGLLPSDWDGLTPPPAGAPNVFAEVDDSSVLGLVDALRLWQFHVDWNNTDNTTFGLDGQPNDVLTVTAFSPLCFLTTNCIPQPGTGPRLDAIADRLMYRLAYRNFGDHESLVVNHTVEAGSGRAGVRWYEVRDPRGSPAIYQQGTFAPAGTENRWMGSLAMDRDGNMALGYSVSSDDVYPSIRYTGRLAGDPLGEMTQGESAIVTGTGAQIANRWGDYSAMSVDPVDDCTFWYTTEYISVTAYSPWRTRIASFKFPSCSSGPRGALTGVVSDAVSHLPIAGAPVQAASGALAFNTASGAGGVYAFSLPTGTYTVAASAYGYAPASIQAVTITVDVTTTQDISLTPVPHYVVSGTVRDALTGWPLYARLSIAGWPGGTIWNDPATGFYSLTLASNVTFTFDVASEVAGYLGARRSVGPLAADRTESFALSVDAATCSAPGYRRPAIYTETFELSHGGYVTSGVNSTWAWGAPTSGPGVAHSGTRVWATNLAGDYANHESSTLISAGIDLSRYACKTLILSWWQWLHTEADYDDAGVRLSQDGGATWSPPVYGPVSGIVSTGWNRRSVVLAASYAVSNLRASFYLTTDATITRPGWYVDDVTVETDVCLPATGGLIVGAVSDANTGLPLAGATVADDIGYVATTVAPSGFYTLFSSPGSRLITAGHPNGYGPVTATVTVILSDTARRDFELPAGRLSAAPLDMSVTLTWGMTATLPVTLTNNGGRPISFTLAELDDGPVAAGRIERPVAALKPFRQYGKSAQGAKLPAPPVAPPYTATHPSAGEVMTSWASGLSQAWGIAYDAARNAVRLVSPERRNWGGDQLLHEYTLDGTHTGRAQLFAWNMVYGPADAAYNWRTGQTWVMNVAPGTDNCIYAMEPELGYTGERICPGNVAGSATGFVNTQRGLAYDPATDTYFAGGWSDEMIYRFDASGAILAQVNAGVAVAGLAYNPHTQRLFALSSANPVQVYVFDVAHQYALIGQFGLAGMSAYGGAGLELDCAGNLWAVDQVTQRGYQVQSGEATNVCAADVAWLSLSPASGVLPLPPLSGTLWLSTSLPVSVRLDTRVFTQPGVYRAQIKLDHATPYVVSNVPVTLTVRPAYIGYLPLVFKD